MADRQNPPKTRKKETGVKMSDRFDSWDRSDRQAEQIALGHFLRDSLANPSRDTTDEVCRACVAAGRPNLAAWLQGHDTPTQRRYWAGIISSLSHVSYFEGRPDQQALAESNRIWFEVQVKRA